MTLDQLALTAAGALVLFIGACAFTARILRDYVEHFEGETIS